MIRQKVAEVTHHTRRGWQGGGPAAGEPYFPKHTISGTYRPVHSRVTHLVDLGECTEQRARCRREAEQAHPLQVQDDGGGHDGLARQPRAGGHELLVEALPGVDVVVEQPPFSGHLQGGGAGVRSSKAGQKYGVSWQQQPRGGQHQRITQEPSFRTASIGVQ